MTRPLQVNRYDSSLLLALATAQRLGEFFIPSDKPSALRLEFYGLCGALRKENRPEACDGLKFFLKQDGLLIKRGATEVVDAVKAALNAAEVVVIPEDASIDAAEAFLSKIGF